MEEKHVINARELWEFLEIKDDFETWLKKRIQEDGLIEGQDYFIVETDRQNPS